MQVQRGEIKQENGVLTLLPWRQLGGFSKSQQVVGDGYAPQSGNLGETVW